MPRPRSASCSPSVRFETHLYRAMHKVGISGRRGPAARDQLAARIAPNHLVASGPELYSPARRDRGRTR